MTDRDPVPAAAAKRRGGGRPFQPGQSGNPAGRPKGARSRLSESVLDALARDFETHGVAAIETVRVNDPAAYLHTIAQLVPKDVALTDADGGPISIQIVTGVPRHLDD